VERENKMEMLGRLTLLAGGMLCFAALAGADTIINGGFSHGNTGFSSDYTASSTCSTGAPFTAGFYFVGTNPVNCNAGWVSMSAPTGGGLHMLIVNGSTGGTARVWYETLSTTPNTLYTFTFWMADIYNLAGDSLATLEFTVDGVVVPGCTGYSPSTPGKWVKETCTYTSGPSSTETLALIDTNTAFEANDFALDDISDPAATVTFTTLHSFDGTDGAGPMAPLVQASNGKLYGTTSSGGASSLGSYGTIFEITTSGTFATAHSFCVESGCPDGSSPHDGLVQAANGNLYGTTASGGVNCCGTIFKITPSGTLTTIESFAAEDGDGPDPTAGLVQAPSGLLYGTAGGGINGAGQVFEMSPSGALTTLYSFCGAFYDGCPKAANAADNTFNGFAPAAGLLRATNGDLYGTTTEGGTTETPSGDYGTVFTITPQGGLTSLYSFCSKSNDTTSCLDGYDPLAALVQATGGDIYGTTQSGGANGAGTIFRITPSGTLKTIYSFCSQPGCTDGEMGGNYGPALIQATDGNLYGTTPYGGATGSGTSTNGYGTVFKITLAGELTTLYTFCIESGCEDGGQPFGGLVQDTNGKLYGTTQIGGTNSPGDGTVFSLSVGLGPFVKTVPTAGLVGATVEILGTDLTGATSVTFDGTAATFTVVRPSQITATVPSGASPGEVQVATPRGTLFSNVSFQVLP
jgi:uncharacterized repeat protein (TIGR03803 family)